MDTEAQEPVDAEEKEPVDTELDAVVDVKSQQIPVDRPQQPANEEPLGLSSGAFDLFGNIQTSFR